MLFSFPDKSYFVSVPLISVEKCNGPLLFCDLSASLISGNFSLSCPSLTCAPHVPYGHRWDCRLLLVPALGTAHWLIAGRPIQTSQSEFSPRIWEVQLTKEVSLSLGVWKWRHVNAEAVGSPVPPCGLRNRKCQSAERESEARKGERILTALSPSCRLRPRPIRISLLDSIESK